jgi:hypothetical protein
VRQRQWGRCRRVAEGRLVVQLEREHRGQLLLVQRKRGVDVQLELLQHERVLRDELILRRELVLQHELFL